MKKLIVMTMILALAAPLAVIAADTRVNLLDQVVVDRTTRNKQVNDYIFLTRDLIQRSWTTPVNLAVPGPVKGRIRVNYVISRSGVLKSAHVVKGSGSAELDRTLIEAMHAASPFPPFPEHVNARSMLVRANFIVADLPTLPVTTVQHTGKPPILPEIVSPVAPEKDAQVNEAQAAHSAVDVDRDAPSVKRKKLIWGVPAGTGTSTQKGSVDDQAPQHTKKLKWGR